MAFVLVGDARIPGQNSSVVDRDRDISLTRIHEYPSIEFIFNTGGNIVNIYADSKQTTIDGVTTTTFVVPRPKFSEPGRVWRASPQELDTLRSELEAALVAMQGLLDPAHPEVAVIFLPSSEAWGR